MLSRTKGNTGRKEHSFPLLPLCWIRTPLPEVVVLIATLLREGCYSCWWWVLILPWKPPSCPGPAQPAVSQVTVSMAGCAKRCKQGLVKFALSLHKLVTGTLIKDIPSMCHALGQGGLGCTFVFREEKEGRYFDVDIVMCVGFSQSTTCGCAAAAAAADSTKMLSYEF
ncbi:hypothetical protein F2P81_007968 [Scophthalmus maximus]|uniref:Uncharacterized protein n=1 Tax=Scophthalmus maximus TaxID=52904 RepID=A0A6A4T0Y6_SCOMX|nr:hypothetical protein F2P81_007968 [Scophthalmus maximus]